MWLDIYYDMCLALYAAPSRKVFERRLKFLKNTHQELYESFREAVLEKAGWRAHNFESKLRDVYKSRVPTANDDSQAIRVADLVVVKTRCGDERQYFAKVIEEYGLFFRAIPIMHDPAVNSQCVSAVAAAKNESRIRLASTSLLTSTLCAFALNKCNADLSHVHVLDVPKPFASSVMEFRKQRMRADNCEYLLQCINADGSINLQKLPDKFREPSGRRCDKATHRLLCLSRLLYYFDVAPLQSSRRVRPFRVRLSSSVIEAESPENAEIPPLEIFEETDDDPEERDWKVQGNPRFLLMGTERVCETFLLEYAQQNGRPLRHCSLRPAYELTRSEETQVRHMQNSKSYKDFNRRCYRRYCVLRSLPPGHDAYRSGIEQFGLFARTDVPAGTFLGVYLGECQLTGNLSDATDRHSHTFGLHLPLLGGTDSTELTLRPRLGKTHSERERNHLPYVNSNLRHWEIAESHRLSQVNEEENSWIEAVNELQKHLFGDSSDVSTEATSRSDSQESDYKSDHAGDHVGDHKSDHAGDHAGDHTESEDAVISLLSSDDDSSDSDPSDSDSEATQVDSDYAQRECFESELPPCPFGCAAEPQCMSRALCPPRQPNLTSSLLLDRGVPYLMFRTLRDVSADEEFFISYGHRYRWIAQSD